MPAITLSRKLGLALLLIATLLLPALYQAHAQAQSQRRAQPYLVAAGRSPIPQPGENFNQPLPAKRLVDDSGDKIVPEAPDGPVAWGAAHRYVGQRITVTGTIVDTYNHRGNVCFLNFSTEWRGKFYIPVFNKVFADLPAPPEQHFLNQTIEVTGKVTLHQNRPNIEVQDISQIRIVE